MSSKSIDNDFSLTIEQVEKFNTEIDKLMYNFNEISKSDFLFFGIEDVCRITGWSKHTVETLFNHPAFPCTDIGKKKLVLKPAFIKFFMDRRCRDNEIYWR